MTTSALTTLPVDVRSLKRLHPTAIRRATPGETARTEATWKDQYRIPVGPADNDPSNIYGTVKVNSWVVATLYNSGAASTSNATGARVMDLPSMGEGKTSVGPALAQKRAEEIAKALGGTIDKAGTAQTRAQWQQRPARQWTYDYAAMEEAMAARDARLRSAKVFVEAQMIAQTPQS